MATPGSGIDVESLRGWIGRSESQTDFVTVPAVHRLAAMLDRDDAFPRAGDPLPAGWHAIFFPRVVSQSRIGPDGHPQRGDFVPPVPLPRRMFAGRRTVFHAPLHVGEEIRKESVIAAVDLKEGRSGTMVFVTVRSEIHSPRGHAITEEQDIVYRGEDHAAARSGAVSPVEPAGRAAAAWSRTVVPDEVLLFRYSALTFNGHRIHYDLPYAAATEGYPALVVNGGLATLLLYELHRAHSCAAIRSMASRNLRPMFAHRPMRLEGGPAGSGAELRVLDAGGAVTLSAQAEWAP